MTISTRLNSLWDPAWNVVITKTPAGYDTIVYGYAFRNQWMWINGITIPTSADVLSYIIWKDYNCQTWRGLAYLEGLSSGIMVPTFV